MARKNKTRVKSGDFVLTILVMALVVFGVIMVFSSSYYSAINDTGDPYSYLKKDVIWAALGLGAMLFCAMFDYRLYAKAAPTVLIVSIVLLGLLFTPLGVTRNYATRWIGVGEFTVMPGEIAKIAAIIFVAWFLSRDPKRIRSFTKGVMPLLGLCVLYFGLIILQPNLSTAITICGIIIGMMFVAGLNVLYLGGIVGLGAAGRYVYDPYRP